jgi:glyoxylase I family protein
VAEIDGTVHHINLSVSDLDHSTSWYRELFALTELTRMSADDGSWSKVILRHPTGLLIGLTQHRINDAQPFDERRCGVDHLALAVPDADSLPEWERRLDERGVPRSGIKTTPLGSLITIRDPDNIQIELYARQP